MVFCCAINFSFFSGIVNDHCIFWNFKDRQLGYFDRKRLMSRIVWESDSDVKKEEADEGANSMEVMPNKG